SPGEATQKFLAATTTRLKTFLQGPKSTSDAADGGESDYALPVSEYLTSEPQSTLGSVGSDDSEPWTLPESTSILQEKKIKKEFLQKTGSKSESVRPTKTRTGTHSKPRKVGAVEQWIRAHKLILVKSGLAVILIFLVWQIGHSVVAQQLVNNGLAQLSNGHPDEALSTFNNAIEVDGRSASAYFNRGNAYRIKGKLSNAFDDYSTSLQLSPNNVEVLSRRATLCQKLEKYEQAASDLTVLLGLVPEDSKPKIYANRADAYAETGQYLKAWQDYGVALKVNPDDHMALTGSAFCLMKLGRYDESISNYNLLVKLDPSDYDARLRRGYCYQKQRNFILAARDFETVLKLSPGNMQALYYRAGLYADQGSLSKAFADLASALKVDPNYAQALVLQADLYSKNGDYANAVADYDQAEKILSFKEKQALLLARAGVYEKMNEYAKAAADYTSAIRLSPNDYLLYMSRANQALKIDPKSVAAQAGRNQTVAATSAPKTVTAASAAASASKSEVMNVSDQSSASNKFDLSKLSTVDLIKKGYDELQKGSADQSISLLSEAVRRNRNDPLSRRYLGYALVAAKRPSEAIGQFEALRKLGGLLRADQLAMQQAVRTAQAMQLEQSRQSGQSKGAEKPKEPEPSKTAAGPDSDALIAKYRAAILVNAKDFESKYNLAVAYSKAGKTQEAIQECLSAISETTDEEQQKRFFHLYQSLSPNQSPVRPVH
ncbi:MAG: tetratricopeptide repeat protein, partial [Candidatus Melainabacteria bacterium]|nr:tetratricopeptide repeat protein [Candidatus Melainabacteria bacterium]